MLTWDSGCWVGKRRMEAAMRNHPDVEFEVHWRPFFLDRSLPQKGVDKV